MPRNSGSSRTGGAKSFNRESRIPRSNLIRDSSNTGDLDVVPFRGELLASQVLREACNLELEGFIES